MNLDSYKLSKYNLKLMLNGKLYLYNAFTGGVGCIDDDKKFIFEDEFDIENILKNNLISEEFLNDLKSGGFIVNKNINEYERIDALHNLMRFSNNEVFGLTIIPTMDCNLRCTYCFEQELGYPSKKMNNKTIEKLIEYVKNNIKENGYFGVTWYGGEPLLGINIIERLQKEFIKICKEKNVKFSSGIITNGYLLNRKISDKLVNLGIISTQVTIDGNKDIHNLKRPLKNGMGSFDKIINNILEANEKLLINIRCNIDRGNKDKIEEFLNLLISKGINKKKNISMYFSLVKDFDTTKTCISNSCYTTKEYSKEELELYKLAKSKNLNILPFTIDPNLTNCSAVSPNSFVIEPDGTIQKCWTTVGNKDLAVGNLYDELVEKNNDLYLANQYKWYSWKGYDNKECKDCNILPLCMGGCPYYDIYNSKMYKDAGYKCNTLKFNLSDALKNYIFYTD